MSRKIKVVISVCIGIGVIAAIAVILFFTWKTPVPQIPQDPLMPFVHADKKINSVQFAMFLKKLSSERKVLLIRSMKKNYNGVPDEALLTRTLVWESSHWVTYPFKDKKFVEYHDLVRWVAEKMKIDKGKIETCTTFQLEHMIIDKAFGNVWDQLTLEQRLKVLEEFEKTQGMRIENKIGIAALGGASVLGTLATTISISGFAFYTTTTSLLASTAGVLGVTLPWAAYTGTTSTIAVLGGPVGWTLAGIAAVTGAALLGTPDVEQTARAIIQIHMIKVDAIEKSGIDVTKYL